MVRHNSGRAGQVTIQRIGKRLPITLAQRRRAGNTRVCIRRFSRCRSSPSREITLREGSTDQGPSMNPDSSSIEGWEESLNVVVAKDSSMVFVGPWFSLLAFVVSGIAL